MKNLGPVEAVLDGPEAALKQLDKAGSPPFRGSISNLSELNGSRLKGGRSNELVVLEGGITLGLPLGGEFQDPDQVTPAKKIPVQSLNPPPSRLIVTEKELPILTVQQVEGPGALLEGREEVKLKGAIWGLSLVSEPDLGCLKERRKQ